MIEITAIILFITFMLIGRMTKPRQLERPVVVERAGNYRVTLAPGLNLAITFIERVAHCYRALPATSGDSATLCVAVNDPALRRYAIESYVLAVTLRCGMLYMQAMLPAADGDIPRRQHGELVQTAMESLPSAEGIGVRQDERLFAAVEQAAAGHDMVIRRLRDDGRSMTP